MAFPARFGALWVCYEAAKFPKLRGMQTVEALDLRPVRWKKMDPNLMWTLWQPLPLSFIATSARSHVVKIRTSQKIGRLDAKTTLNSAVLWQTIPTPHGVPRPPVVLCVYCVSLEICAEPFSAIQLRKIL